MARSAILQRAAISLAAALALSVGVQAADVDYPEDDGPGPGPRSGPRSESRPDPEPGPGSGRRSTWELNTSLTFYQYLEPFPRVDSAGACRNRCVHDRRCTGWTYYDGTFRGAGAASYRLQRVCVMGVDLKDRQRANRPGRTSGIVKRGYGDDDY